MEGRAALASFISKSRGCKLSALRITCSLGNTKALSWLQERCIKSSLTKALSIHIKPQGTSGAHNCSTSKGNRTEIATVPTLKLQWCSSALPGKATCLLQFEPVTTQEILLWFGFPFLPPWKYWGDQRWKKRWSFSVVKIHNMGTHLTPHRICDNEAEYPMKNQRW